MTNQAGLLDIGRAILIQVVNAAKPRLANFAPVHVLNPSLANDIMSSNWEP